MEQLKKIIQVAGQKVKADYVIKNCKIVDVYSHSIIDGDIAFCDGKIAGIGQYSGVIEYDAKGKYALPGLIESHIHIESSFLTPEEFSRLVVCHGTTTVIADPHEIVNVSGINGLNYMISAAQNSVIDIKYMMPSCVPSTPFEHSGAVVDSVAMYAPIKDDFILGLGEFMNAVGVVNCDTECLKKIKVCKKNNKIIDGHSPGLSGYDLSAYAACGVITDHECSTVEQMNERIRNGMYVQLRHGSACHDLKNLIKGVNEYNSRRCLLCSDDRQPVTILESGDLDDHLRICVENGLDPVTAVQMASLNASECYALNDRGSLTPGKRADVILVDNLKDFNVNEVWVYGELVAKEGVCLKDVKRTDTTAVLGSVHIKDFDKSKIALKLKSNKVNVIGINSGSIVTKKLVKTVRVDDKGDFVFDLSEDVAKICVIERHHNTGNLCTALISGYGIKKGAVAVTIAHDSHNLIAVGVNNDEIECAVKAIEGQNGGAVVVKDGKVIASLPLPVAGLMSDKSGQWVQGELDKLYKACVDECGVNPELDPVMTLAFMSLPVIPELKITDMGLFDYNKFDFINIEADK